MQTNLETLRAEMDELRQTVERLQRRPPRLGRGGRLLLVGFGLLLGLMLDRLAHGEAYANPQGDKDLTCKSLTVLGPGGKATMKLGTDEDGGIIQINGVDGNPRTIVAVAPKQGGGLINLFDTKQKLRIVLEGNDNGGQIEKR